MNRHSTAMIDARVLETEHGSHLPGSESPGPANAAGASAHTSTAQRDRRLNMDSPVEDRTGERPTTNNNILTPEREEYILLFNAGHLAEARRLARRMCAIEASTVWVNNLANVIREQGNLASAFDLYLTNAHLLSKASDYDAAKFCNAFALTSQEYGDQTGVVEYYDRALFYYKLASERYQRAGLPNKVAACLYNTGLLLVSTGYPDRALECFDRAEFLYTQGKDLPRLAMVDVGRSLAYSKRAVLALTPVREAERRAFDEANKAYSAAKERI